MTKRRILTLIISLIFLEKAFAIYERPLVVVICSRNNARWCKLNLLSILGQKYSNFRVLYLNDKSTDATKQIVTDFCLHCQTISSQQIFYEFLSKATEEEKIFWRDSGIRMDQFVLPQEKIPFQSIDFDDTLSPHIGFVTEKFSQEVNRKRTFFTLVSNVNHCGAMANHYRAAHSTDNLEIIVHVDGDDWLPDDEVFKRLNEVYQNVDVWFTHGNLIEYTYGHTSWCEPIPSEVIAANTFRKFKCPSHLRTFYSWLFKDIPLEAFLYEGKFLKATCDLAMMFAIAEKAGERHAFISHPNYVYNMFSPQNDNKLYTDLQNDMDAYIRKRTPFQRLEKALYP